MANQRRMKRKQRPDAFEEDDDDDVEEKEQDDAEEDEEDEEEENGGASPSGRRQPVYNVDGIHEKLEDIGWTEQAAWEETLMVTNAQDTVVDNVDDDLARELAFYNQALASTQEAIHRFEAAGTKWLRPPDYYAEMVKTDDHMAKVKEQLMFEQSQIELAEERRKQREQKQYSKQVQAERLKQKAQDKKHQIDSISKLRKQREKSGFAGELDMDAEIKNLQPGKVQQRSRFQDRNSAPGGRGKADPPNKKRQAKDSKFGFGGSKRLKKQNDASSAANMDSYKGSRPDAGKKRGGKGGPLKAKGGVKKRAGAKGGAAQRPGKARRQTMKGGKGKGRK